MKTNCYKIRQGMLVLIFIGLINVSCKENQIFSGNCEPEYNETINNFTTGKWKLIEVKEVFQTAQTSDYSCNNVIFTFTENGSLEVESDVEEVRGFDEGTYNYSVKNEPTYGIYENEISVNIENATFACKIENGEMILDDSPLDGSIITLIKI